LICVIRITLVAELFEIMSQMKLTCFFVRQLWMSKWFAVSHKQGWFIVTK